MMLTIILCQIDRVCHAEQRRKVQNFTTNTFDTMRLTMIKNVVMLLRRNSLLLVLLLCVHFGRHHHQCNHYHRSSTTSSNAILLVVDAWPILVTATIQRNGMNVSPLKRIASSSSTSFMSTNRDDGDENDDRRILPNAIDSRRNFLLLSATLPLVMTSSPTTMPKANAAETIGLDPDCTDRSCLGVWDGLFADCPHGGVPGGGGAGCTSSQDDTPGIFSEPWDYSESRSLDWQTQMRLLRPTIELVSSKRGDKCETLIQEGRYLRVLFEDKKTREQSIGEFYFTPNDTTVQFRIGTVPSSSSSPSSLLTAFGSQRNIDRAEEIRKELRYLKIPVLRNRKRSLFFVESDLDTFGPGSAALGPPEEMKRSDVDRGGDISMKKSSGSSSGRLSDNVDPKLKIDLLQQFPIQ
mmetsp:Transcript_52253/g.126277  ORF Transcript_52253/g.126277 Transcript_52253/m.126277 type:complete len:408 (+) Transcript_52253:1-1224(+)